MLRLNKHAITLFAMVASVACANRSPARTITATVPFGGDIAPVGDEVSTFWNDLDAACPLIAVTATPSGLDASKSGHWAAVKDYCSSTPHDASRVGFSAKLNRDELLKPIIAAVTSAGSDLSTLGGGAGTLFASSATFGSLNTTSLIDAALRGLGQFLVKRAELELRTYAVDKLRTVAQCEKRLDESAIHRLLVHSCAYLGSGTGTLNGGFGPGLRSAFTEDLTALPRNLVREVPPEGGVEQLFVRVAFESAAILVEDPDPIQIVARVETLAADTKTDAAGNRAPGDESFQCRGDNALVAKCNDAKATLYLAAVLARIVIVDGIPIRLNGSQLLEGLVDRLQTALGKMPPGDLRDSLEVLIKAGLPVADWKRLLGELRDDADATIASLKAARQVLRDVPATASTEERAKAIVDSVRHAVRAIDRSIGLASCIGRVAKAKTPLDCTMQRSYIPPQLADFLDALRRKDIAGVMALGLALARGALGDDAYGRLITSDLARLLSFGAELANAKTPDEAEAAIEAISMPPGGYKEKRRRSFFSVTGLLGVSAGLERVAGLKDNTGVTTSVLGAVGIDYNRHIPDSNWTWGVFLTVLDLGGVLNVRVAGDDTAKEGAVTKTIEDAPTVGLPQVFAPGIGLRFGLGGSPVVFMVGGQIVPRGRLVTDDRATVDTSDDVEKERTAIRLMATFAVDVTIWSF